MDQIATSNIEPVTDLVDTLVPESLLIAATEQLSRYAKNYVTYVSWVNWRQGFQIVMSWHGNPSLRCYVCFETHSDRQAVFKQVFEEFAAAGQKPKTIDGHGWSAPDYTLYSGDFISVNAVARAAAAQGVNFTVIYNQESVSARPLFGVMGIPLVPGEMGKEWVNGEFIPYSCPTGMNL